MTPPDAADADGTGSSDAGLITSDRLERVVAGASVVFTLVLLGYVLWQGATTPAGTVPTASVEAVEPLPSDEGIPDALGVTVRIENHGSTGIEIAVVGVECGDAERTIEFTNVPGNGFETATAICPPGTTPTVTIQSWIDG